MLRSPKFGEMVDEFATGLRTCQGLRNDAMVHPCMTGLTEAAALRWLQYTQDLAQIPDLCLEVPEELTESCRSGLEKYVR